MNRKLKKRIKELCGLNSLSKEAKAARCEEILHNSELKQELCNKSAGISFKDIDKVLRQEIEGAPKSREQEEYDEIEVYFPAKIHPEQEWGEQKPKRKLIGKEYSMDEVNELINYNSMTEWNDATKPEQIADTTYSQEEVYTLLEHMNYDPRNFSKK